MSDQLSDEAIVAWEYDVFLSYKRVDDDRRAVLHDALTAAGFSVWWDAKLQSGAWRTQLAGRIRNAKLAVAVWSEAAAAAPEEVGDEMSQARGLDRLMALKTDGAIIPRLFGEQNFMPFDGWADEARRSAQLAAIVAEVRRRVGKPTYQVIATGAAAPAIPVEFGDIPGAPAKLIGREAERAMLQRAWDSRAPAKVNAVVLHALGGAGKSALLRTFANDLLADGGGGAARIYGWSAYSQGSGEQKRADADSFITQALGDLGHRGDIPKDPVERARALARLIQRERVLLLLDGLEPLQDPPNVNKGRFKDRGLAELVKVLSLQNPGLMVLTTRQEVPELQGLGALVTNHPLDKLSPDAGAKLLAHLGVTGRRRELEAAVTDLDGHALSVTLLGTYLAEVHGGDIRHRDQFNFADIVLSPEEQSELLTDKTIIPAKRAAKVMRGYLDQFEKLTKTATIEGLGGPERALLHLLGLFDRPADGDAVHKLLAQHIPGLTDELFFERVEATSGWWPFKSRTVELRGVPIEKRSARLREAKSRLRKLRLIASATKHDPRGFDAHPVVRAFFASQLAETAPEAAQTAHEILYRHYAATAPDLPDAINEFQPLFRAVYHGIKAGQVQEVFDEVFCKRMLRGKEYYVTHVFGDFEARLAASAHFFSRPWQLLLCGLRTDSQAELLAMVGNALVCVGRPVESLAPRLYSLELFASIGDRIGAAEVGAQLSNTLLTLGRIGGALNVAEDTLTHAYESNDTTQIAARLLNYAAVFYIRGDVKRAEAIFKEAEPLIVGQHRPMRHTHSSLPSFRYGELIIDLGLAEQALIQGSTHLELGRRYLGKGMSLHNIGFATLLIGCAMSSLSRSEAIQALDEAVAVFRKAGTLQHLPLALLARAAHQRRCAAAGESALIEAIRADLDEVEDIAGSEMRLHLTDLALERARLALDVPTAFASPAAALSEARTHTDTAAALIIETGYHLRDGEVDKLRGMFSAMM